MTYEIRLTRLAEKQLADIPKPDAKKIIHKLEKLRTDPFPDGYKKLSGKDSEYRIRQGDYRIVYTIQGEKLIILVLKIGHRREIYRD